MARHAALIAAGERPAAVVLGWIDDRYVKARHEERWLVGAVLDGHHWLTAYAAAGVPARVLLFARVGRGRWRRRRPGGTGGDGRGVQLPGLTPAPQVEGAGGGAVPLPVRTVRTRRRCGRCTFRCRERSRPPSGRRRTLCDAPGRPAPVRRSGAQRGCRRWDAPPGPGGHQRNADLGKRHDAAVRAPAVSISEIGAVRGSVNHLAVRRVRQGKSCWRFWVWTSQNLGQWRAGSCRFGATCP